MSLPIPDLRFESTFRRQLASRAKTEALVSSNDNEKLPGEPLEEPVITWRTIATVVLRDIMVMPLLQGIIYTGALMLVRPWLRAVTRFGYNSAAMLMSQFKSAVRYGALN